jgi:hypothetical protein
LRHLLLVCLHPAAPVQQLDVNLTQPQQNQLLLLRALGNLGLDCGSLSRAPPRLGCRLRGKEPSFNGGKPLMQIG